MTTGLSFLCGAVIISIMQKALLRVGPLTTQVIASAGWAQSNPECPSSQPWADEFERVFAYAYSKGQFTNYFNRLTSKSYSQFDSSLAELRVSHYLNIEGFPTVRWEPIPVSGNAGEFLVECSSGEKVFVEVKSPGWESELEANEIKSGRVKQPKYQDLETRWIDNAGAIRFAIRKAYKKFDPGSANLLIIADDLFVSLETGPETYAQKALFYDPTPTSQDPLYQEQRGDFVTSNFENLGGVGLFWVDQASDPFGYKMQLFLNPTALSTAALPEVMARHPSFR